MPIKVLVIDDDIAITDLMSLLLQTHGFEPITTNSGTEGIKFAAEKNPGIVLLDLMMPDLDGQQVCRAIRKFSGVPILVLSAVNDPGMVASVLDAGADGFLSKPVPTSVLLAHIRKMAKPLPTGSLGVAQPGISSTAIRKNTQPLVSRPHA